MHQPDSRMQKLTMLHHLKQKILIILFPIENNGKCLEEIYTSKLVVIKHRLYLSIKAISENLFKCFLTQNHWSIRDINKNGFIMTSVSLHATFKSVKIMHLNCYLSY